jgi:hypothetical protein
LNPKSSRWIISNRKSVGEYFGLCSWEFGK